MSGSVVAALALVGTAVAASVLYFIDERIAQTVMVTGFAVAAVSALVMGLSKDREQ